MYYKVKIDAPELIPDKVTTDGCLKFRDDTPWLYTRGEAIKKAHNWFGKIVKVENIPTVTEVSMSVLIGKDLLFGVREILKGRELFVSSDVESINSFIYDGDVFQTILLELEKLEKENDDFKIKDEIRNQLNELCLLVTSKVVLINDMCFS